MPNKPVEATANAAPHLDDLRKNKNMLTPNRQFICDTCGQIIDKPEEGWLEWISDYEERKIHSFRITHHQMHSPLKGSEGCYRHGNARGRSDDHLNNVMKYLIPELLMHLDPGKYHDPNNERRQISDMRNYVDTFRRLTIPYYEEARFYWDQAIADGFFDGENEVSIYSESTLKRVIAAYSEF